jgi:hypothetical protein
MKSRGDKCIALFERHPRTDLTTLVIHNQRYNLGELSEAYYESALVISRKFDGQAVSDIFLLPYLYLMRHAYELSLKDGLLILKNLKIEHFAADPDELFQNKSRIDYIKSFEHNLMRLLNEFKKDYNSFNFEEKFPREIETVLNLLHQADQSSTEFRYGTPPQNQPSYIDARSLCTELSREFRRLALVIDYAHGTCSYLPTDRYKKPDSDKPIKDALIDEDE